MIVSSIRTEAKNPTPDAVIGLRLYGPSFKKYGLRIDLTKEVVEQLRSILKREVQS